MSRLRTAVDLLKSVLAEPIRSVRQMGRVPDALRGSRFSASLSVPPAQPLTAVVQQAAPNPLREFFDERREGRGIWKWLHYFDIYNRHLQKFVGRPAHIVEIGVYSGGSLDMWRDYFGEQARITGIDIAPECRAYEDERTNIVIGDQQDRSFWARFRADNADVDVVIDDGGHRVEQQLVTLEEMLPHIRPGGVYICEDVHGRGSHFAAFAHALADNLNESQPVADGSGTLRYRATPFQSAIESISFYPCVVVIEKTAAPRTEFTAPKHGTAWQPFLD
jgi:cephalosporin hydroxylase